jgi:predicted DNA-binding transcriptional regulator AlpA
MNRPPIRPRDLKSRETIPLRSSPSDEYRPGENVANIGLPSPTASEYKPGINDPAETPDRPTVSQHKPGQNDLETAATPRPEIPRLTWRLEELCKALGVSRRALERERSAGRLPRPDMTIGRMPLWKPETIHAWLERGGRR